MAVFRASVQAWLWLDPLPDVVVEAGAVVEVEVVEVEVVEVVDGAVVVVVDVDEPPPEVPPPGPELLAAEQVLSASARSAAAVRRSLSAFSWAVTTACWAACRAAVLFDVDAAVRTVPDPPTAEVVAADAADEETVVVCPASSADSLASSAPSEVWAAVTASWSVVGTREARTCAALTCSPTVTDTDDTVPATWKLADASLTGWSVPVTWRVLVTVDLDTVAVRYAADAELVAADIETPATAAAATAQPPTRARRPARRATGLAIGRAATGSEAGRAGLSAGRGDSHRGR
jgi:hypothetical protein